MAKKRSGEVLVRDWKAGRGFALRFSAYGRRRYLTLGFESDGWTKARAEEELANVLADVRRGLWVSPRRGAGEGTAAGTRASRRGFGRAGEQQAPALGADMNFGEFAPWALEVRKARHGEAHHRNLQWGLRHLMPFFAETPLAAIDAEAIDAYSAAKIEEGERLQAAIDRGDPYRDEHGRVRKPLAATSINKTIKVLSWFLGLAVQYKRIPENAAAGRERLLKARPKPPVHLDTAEQIEALLDAAAELDRDPGHLCCEREAIVATLIFAGPRAHELGYMLERDIDLANTRIFSAAQRPRPACARSASSRSSTTSSRLTRRALPPLVRTPSPSRRAPAGGATAATCASGSCARSSSAPTNCCASGVSCRCRKVYRPTSCATPSPRFSPRSAPTQPH